MALTNNCCWLVAWRREDCVRALIAKQATHSAAQFRARVCPTQSLSLWQDVSRRAARGRGLELSYHHACSKDQKLAMRVTGRAVCACPVPTLIARSSQASLHSLMHMHMPPVSMPTPTSVQMTCSLTGLQGSNRLCLYKLCTPAQCLHTHVCTWHELSTIHVL